MVLYPTPRAARALALATSLAALMVSLPSPAGAKRAAPPETEVCNRSKSTRWFATLSYGGVGTWLTQGWVALAPGQCQQPLADRIAVWKPLRSVEGLDRSSRQPLCVGHRPSPKARKLKPFSIRGRMSELESKSFCRKRRGLMVPFFIPSPKVVIR